MRLTQADVGVLLIAWLAILEPAQALAEEVGAQHDAGAVGVEAPCGSRCCPLPPDPCSLWGRQRLTGDWWGARSRLERRGLRFDFESTHVGMDRLAGLGSDSTQWGGRLDAYVTLDLERAGLWCGGGVRAHLEYRYGDLEPFRGGLLSPAALNAFLPIGSEEEVVLSALYLTQQLGKTTSLQVGRISSPDLYDADPFFGGLGNRRFLNGAFVAPTNGVQPAVMFGALATVKKLPWIWTFMVHDPEDRSQSYALADLFDKGVVGLVGATRVGKLAGRTSTWSLNATYSSQDGADLAGVFFPPEIRVENRKERSWSIGAGASHLLKERPGKPGQGWGLFVKAALCDGNPNPIQAFVSGGLGGKALFACRPDDSFGVGAYWFNYSNDLQDTLDPLREIEDETGVEAYYAYALTPWCHLTADVQVIGPARTDETAVLASLRLNLRF